MVVNNTAYLCLCWTHPAYRVMLSTVACSLDGFEMLPTSMEPIDEDDDPLFEGMLSVSVSLSVSPSPLSLHVCVPHAPVYTTC